MGEGLLRKFSYVPLQLKQSGRLRLQIFSLKKKEKEKLYRFCDFFQSDKGPADPTD